MSGRPASPQIHQSSSTPWPRLCSIVCARFRESDHDSIIHPPSYIPVCMHAGTRVLLPSPYMHTHRHLHICMQGSECNRQQELPSSLHCSDRQADRQTDMRAHTHRDKTSRSIYPARQPASSYTLPLLVWTWLAPCLACLLALVGK